MVGVKWHPTPLTQRATLSLKPIGKKLAEELATLLPPETVKGRRVRLMLQDEARFGRVVRIRRCWAPTPLRPVASNGY
jgi:hypothetical protein